MLQTYYPALRHTDYRIEYNIRTYSDVNEIRRIMKEQPQKLSLNEFYLLAQDCQPGSEEFNDVFENSRAHVSIRPRSQPQRSSPAPSNAVISTRLPASSTRQELQKKPNTSEVCAKPEGNYSAARAYFEKSSSIPEAADAIRQLDKLNAR